MNGYSSGAGPTPISTSGTTLASVSLPPGSYVVNASVEMDLFDGDSVSCSLIDHGGTMASAWDNIAGLDTLPLTAPSTAGGTVSLVCQDSAGGASIGGADITAIPVAVLNPS